MVLKCYELSFAFHSPLAMRCYAMPDGRWKRPLTRVYMFLILLYKQKIRIQKTEQKMEEQCNRITDRTWKAIKPDTLCDLTSNPGAVGKVITQKDVIEAVADPRCLEIYGKDEKAVKALRSLSEEEQEGTLKNCFPSDTYEWFPIRILWRGLKWFRKNQRKLISAKPAEKLLKENTCAIPL